MPTYECIPLHLHISFVTEFTLLSIVCLLKYHRDLLFMCAVVVAVCDTVLHKVGPIARRSDMPRHRRSSLGRRAFSVAGPMV